MPGTTLRVTRDPTVEPARLTAEQRTTLCDELYSVHAQIFDGVDRDAFRRYVVEPEDARTRLQVFRDVDGRAIGYIAIHRYLREVGGEQALILRSEVGLLRAYRGRALQARFVLAETARAWLQHPGRTKYVFACPVHPSSFYGVTRRATRSWPRPGEVVPSAIRTLMADLSASFGMGHVAGADPLVRRVGWVTRESPEDRAYWEAHPAREVQFYRRLNPGYAQGHGLLMLVPLTVPLVVRGALGRAVEVLSRAVRRTPRRASRDRRSQSKGRAHETTCPG